MKTRTFRLRATALAFGALASISLGSDHADPMSLNVFKLQEDPAANITDLHAFVVDANGIPVLTQEGIAAGKGDQLIISLCLRRRLLPAQIDKLESKENLSKYSFRVHLDLNPEIRFFDPAMTRDGRNYKAALDDLGAKIAAAATEREIERKAPMRTNAPSAQGKLDGLLTARGALIAQHQQDQTMQALYGGIMDNPSGIAEEAVLDYHVDFAADGENSEASLNATLSNIQGIPGQPNVVIEGRKSLDGMRDITVAKPWKQGEINVQAGVFDDPFIFPRFFRSNVVGIVTSIPLARLHRPDGQSVRGRPILLWATTHLPDGKVADHVGRSLRTQLPRFGYINEMHPSKHVAEITRVHAEPTLMENGLATFLAPLEAHRHYDSAPDVMVYDLARPAKFPNGRWLADDVSQTLADAGETLLYELSYTESKQVPRATTNDKEFRATFPYLAPRWTTQQSADFAKPGVKFGDFDMGESGDRPEAHDATIPGTKLTGMSVPDAPESAAIAPPDFNIAVWKSIWKGLAIGLVGFGVLALFATRGLLRRIAIIIITLCSLCMIAPIKAGRVMNTDPNFMKQPLSKFNLLLGGSGVIGLLGLWALYAFGIRRGIRVAAAESILPLGEQRPQQADFQYEGTTFNEVRNEVFKDPYYGSIWGETNDRPLPVYRTTFAGVARGMWSLSRRFLFLDAAQRTVVSHADLRRGADGKGVERLIHPNGICLTGTWKIADDCPTDFTGYFAKGSEGLVVTRYSTGLKVRRGEKRTLSMVGKLYPTRKKDEKQRTASFITQEDLGAAYSEGIHNAVLRNAPNITVTKRFPDFSTLFLFAFTFNRADTRNSERQLYEIAELGKPAGVPTRCPRFMQLKISSQKIGGGDETADFRDEVLAQIYDRGVAAPVRKLVFDIEVSDAGEVKGLINKGIEGADWKKIGTITFDEAVASYSGDFVIHFHHPKWRNDRNDPNSETGPGKIYMLINKVISAVGRVFQPFGK